MSSRHLSQSCGCSHRICILLKLVSNIVWLFGRFPLVGGLFYRYKLRMRIKLFPVVQVAFVIFAGSTFARADSATQLQRGKYLVERVGVCADCHTPRNWRGRFEADHSLTGSKLLFAPMDKAIPWAPVAPAIAGLPGFATDELAVKYFETGINGAARESLPPMPQLRLAHDDALAVVAYLRSLKPAVLK